MPDSKRSRRLPAKMRERLAGWRPGIAWQLGIAFIGVAALAGIANFAVQRTISITTTRVVADAAVAQTRSGLRRPESGIRHGDGTMALPALERLSTAVQTARLVPAAERRQRAHAAAGEVRSTLLRLHGSAEHAEAALRAGDEIIDIEADRDAAYAQYIATLSRVEDRLQVAMDNAWRIFGRVVARQALVIADQRIEDLRRRAALLRGTEYSPAELAEVAAIEEQLGDALVAGERTFTRTQGAAWFAEVSAEVAQFSTLRERIADLDVRRKQVLPLFRVELALVRARLHTRVQLRAATGGSTSTPVVLPKQVADRPLVAAAPWETRPQFTTRQQAVEEGLEPAGLAWISAAVLALLLAVSVITVLSILRPVQRLIAATQRIALGEAGVRVPRGSTRELDRLGTAFNSMAAQLESARSMARTYQQQLEARVVERTRQLQHQAGHDALTQLPNRRQLFEHLRGVLARASGGQGRAGLFFIDLDNFKTINDGRGHGYGDRVLVAIAERLAATAGGRGQAARFGGDEFTLVVEGADAETSLIDIGQSLVRAFQQPLRLDGSDLLVSVSVGAAFHPEHGADAESLLRAADAALFHAKSQGRSQLAVFTPELLEQASVRFTTEQGLRHAVERGEFELEFQPEIDISRMEVAVCEALLRWRRPDGTLAGPDQFLSVAQDSGLIVEISDWVLRAAVEAAARWRRADHPDLRVAINASSRQLADPSFAERVGALLGEHGLPPSALEIELTETVLQTGEGTIAGLRRLQQMGITVALDDFGTGYSSLASLEQLPLSRVKLDRSLIAGIDGSGRAASIANAIISLCRDLGMQVTAEGVERPAQLSMLRDSGITVQGYLLSRPVPESQLNPTLRALPGLLQSLLLDEVPRTGADIVQLGKGRRTRRSRSAASEV